MCGIDAWSKLRDQVPLERFGRDTVSLIKWIDVYWKTYSNSKFLDLTKFKTLLDIKGSKLDESDKLIIFNILKKADSLSPDENKDTFNLLIELAFSGELAMIYARYEEGEEIDIITESALLQRKYSSILSSQNELFNWEDSDIDNILSDTDEDTGFKLNFCGLRDKIQGLKCGDNIAVCAPTDAGKTSFLASMAVDFNTQMLSNPDKYKDRCILWLVNESVAKQAVIRVYNASLNKGMGEIKEIYKQGKLETMLSNKLGGLPLGNIKIKNAHSITLSQIITLVNELKPAVLITDMTANIKGGYKGANKTETQNIEYIWQTLRELMAENDCIHVGTVQVSADGYNTMYPPMTALKQSKLGVQGTLDLCIMLGRLDPNSFPQHVNLRGISTPKNKRPRSGCKGLNQMQINFDPYRCQWDFGITNTIEIKEPEEELVCNSKLH